MSYSFARKFDLSTPGKGVGGMVAKESGPGFLWPAALIGAYAGMGYGVYLVFTGSFLTGVLVFFGAPALAAVVVVTTGYTI